MTQGKTVARLLAIMAVAFAGVTSASATQYQWTLSGGGDSGSGLLVTGAADGTGVDVLSFTGSIDGQSVTLYGGQPGGNGASGPDGYYYNNVLYPSLDSGNPNCAGGATLVDGCGIFFQIGSGYGNIFDNYSGTGTGAYALSFTSSTSTNHNVDFTIAATPEPSSFALLGTGLLGVAGLFKRRLL